MIRIVCRYKIVNSDSWSTSWKTDCGKVVRYYADDEVGMSFVKLPTADDCKFCTYCGLPIVLKSPGINHA